MTASPFLVDYERLRALASDRVVRRGLTCFKEDRVVDLGWDETRIWGTVADSRAHEPYAVEVELNDDREPLIACDCPFE